MIKKACIADRISNTAKNIPINAGRDLNLEAIMKVSAVAKIDAQQATAPENVVPLATDTIIATKQPGIDRNPGTVIGSRRKTMTPMA